MYLVCRPISPLFPYTTLFRSDEVLDPETGSGSEILRSYLLATIVSYGVPLRHVPPSFPVISVTSPSLPRNPPAPTLCQGGAARQGGDRKSTRLNSSHRCISYAVRSLPSFPTRRSSDLMRSSIQKRVAAARSSGPICSRRSSLMASRCATYLLRSRSSALQARPCLEIRPRPPYARGVRLGKEEIGRAHV